MSYKSGYTGAQIDTNIVVVANKTYTGSSTQAFATVAIGVTGLATMSDGVKVCNVAVADTNTL